MNYWLFFVLLDGLYTHFKFPEKNPFLILIDLNRKNFFLFNL